MHDHAPPYRCPTKPELPEPPPMRQVMDDAMMSRQWFVVVLTAAVLITGAVLTINSQLRQAPTKQAISSIPSNPDIGNPSTVQFAALQESPVDDKVICGLVNYEKVDNGGWTGYHPVMIYGKVMLDRDANPAENASYTHFCSVAGT